MENLLFLRYIAGSMYQVNRLRLRFMLLFFVFPVSFVGAATIRWTGAEDVRWHNSRNWDLRVPTDLDDAIIPSGHTVVIDQSVEVESLTSYGILSSSGTVVEFKDMATFGNNSETTFNNVDFKSREVRIGVTGAAGGATVRFTGSESRLLTRGELSIEAANTLNIEGGIITSGELIVNGRLNTRSGNMKVNGNLNGTGRVDAGNTSMKVLGDFNIQTFNCETSRIVLLGATEVNNASVFNDLRISNGNATFRAGLTVNGTTEFYSRLSVNPVAINITGNVILNDAVSLFAPTTINATADITLGGAINERNDLVIFSLNGIININGAIGDLKPPSSVALITTNTNNVNIGANISSEENINIGGAITLTNNVTLESTGKGGEIRLSRAVDGAYNLNVQATDGTISVNNTVGAVTTVSLVNLTATTINVGADISSVSNISITGAITLTGNVQLRSINRAGIITLGGTVDGAYSLNVQATDGTINVDSTIGSGTTVSSVDLTATTINVGADISSVGNMNISGAFILTGDNVTLAGSAVVVNGGIDSDSVGNIRNLAFDSTNQMTLQNPIGSIQAIDNLEISSGSILNTNDNSIELSGDLDGDGTVFAGSSSITLGGNLSIANFMPATSTVILSGDTDIDLSAMNLYRLEIKKATRGSTVTATGNLDIEDSLIVDAGTWSAGENENSAHTHTIRGELIFGRNSGFNAQKSTVNFFGGGMKSINLAEADFEPRFHNLVIALFRSTDVMSIDDGSIEITGSFNLQQGLLAVRNGDINFLGGDFVIGINASIDSTLLPGRIVFEKNGTSDDTSTISLPGRTATYNLSENILVTDSLVTVERHNDNGTLKFEWNDMTINSITPLNVKADKKVGIILPPLTGSRLDITGTMKLEGNGVIPVINMSNWDFDVADLNNTKGIIKLTGEQSTQTIPVLTAKNQYGRIVYTEGAGAATIRIPEFWNLDIDTEDQEAILQQDITVYGDNPSTDFTIGPGMATNSVLNGIRLISGSLNADEKKFIVHGSWISSGIIYSEDTNEAARLHFRGNLPAFVGGNNKFFEFVVDVNDDANLKGKILYMESGKELKMVGGTETRKATITLKGDATGTNIPPVLTVRQRKAGSAPFPGSGGEWIYLVASNAQAAFPNPLEEHYWSISLGANKTAMENTVSREFKQLYVMDSKADPAFSDPVGGAVITNDVLGWLGGVYVLDSETRDSDNNGRIDRIIVQLSTSHSSRADVFSNVIIKAANYDVKEIGPGADDQKFIIHLYEKELDTRETPYWYFKENFSLVDPYGRVFDFLPGLIKKIDGNDVTVPRDRAPPVVAYTLAMAGRNEIMVRFSEPVIQSSNRKLGTGNFKTVAGGPGPSQVVSSIEFLDGDAKQGTGNSASQVLLKVQNKISISEIMGQVAIEFTDIKDIPLLDSTRTVVGGGNRLKGVGDSPVTHRISDLVLGNADNFPVQPILAYSDKFGLPSGVASVNDFSGEGFLLRGGLGIDLQRNAGVTAEPKIIYGTDISTDYRRDDNENGIWLGNFVSDVTRPGGFTGLVPRPYTEFISVSKQSLKANTFKYKIDEKSMQKISRLDFIVQWPGNNLYSVRIIDPTAPDWYNRLAPWSINFGAVKQQAGGVTILNNIINPNENEKTFLVYDLTENGTVTIQVFDLAGDMVSVLQRGHKNVGEHSVTWDGRNKAGSVVARGIYFVRYSGPGGIDQVRKVMVVK